MTTAEFHETKVLEGVHEVTGAIVAAFWRNRTGQGGRQFCAGAWSRAPHIGMSVELDAEFGGGRFFGTMPRSVERQMIALLFENCEACVNYTELIEHLGDLPVRFAATFERARTHGRQDGFFKLPRNAALIEREAS